MKYLAKQDTLPKRTPLPPPPQNKSDDRCTLLTPQSQPPAITRLRCWLYGGKIAAGWPSVLVKRLQVVVVIVEVVGGGGGGGERARSMEGRNRLQTSQANLSPLQ